MSKTWYPVIDITKCVECGICADFCTHGVYEKRGERPIVVNPERCVHGCKGCSKQCPQEAIEYVGDNGQENGGCSCGCCCGN